MDKNTKIIGYDFQGWPIKRMTFREIKEVFNKIPEEKLDEYVQVLTDDGMGYSPTIQYVTNAYEDSIWIEPIHYLDWYETLNGDVVQAFHYWGTNDSKQQLHDKLYWRYSDNRDVLTKILPNIIEGDYIVLESKPRIVPEDEFLTHYKKI